MEQVTLRVRGMRCNSCEMLVREALQEVEGVVKAVVDIGKGTASVTYDERKAGEEKFRRAVETEGYSLE